MTAPQRRLTWIQALCWPALLLALAGSVSNLAWSFASVQDGNLALGYIQAGAVDLGLIALAVGIAARRKQQNPTRWLWLGLAFFGGVSVFGNLVHGYTHAQEIAAPAWLSVARPVVLAAVLPALVLILSEVVGFDLRGVTGTVTKPRAIVENETGIETTQFANAQRNQNAIAAHTGTGNGHKQYDCPLCGRTCESQPQYAAHLRQCRQRQAVAAAQEAQP